MATISLRCPANHPSIRNHDVRLGISNSNPTQLAPLPRSWPMPDPMVGILASTPLPVSSPRPPRRADAETCAKIVDRKVAREKAVLPENLDEWMRDSVVEIVKNLREAPLFVHVYSSDNGGAALLKTEKAIAEDWPAATRRWKDGDAPSPDGVILVEELRDEDGLDADEEAEEEGSRAWGLVVQGRGAECGPACYLLKTSQVGSGMGLGCTHFCLMRVKNFRESALSQLRDSWLLQ